jgi:hypothetical protein
VSFEYRNFPDITNMCALCRRDDGGTPYLHLLSIATEGEYTPAICNRCVEHMFNNWPNKPKPEVKVVERGPSDEQVAAIGRFVVDLFERFASERAEVKRDDNAADNAKRAATPHADTVEQQQRKARKRAQGTD